MNDPDEEDYRWLVARERGDHLGHVPAAARAPYDQLGALLGSGVAPSAGWRQRVLDAIDAADEAEAAERAANPAPEPAVVAPPEPAIVAPVVPLRPAKPREPMRRLWIAGGLAAMAAALLVYFALPRTSTTTGAIALATEVRRDPTVRRAEPGRADQANLGDTLVVRAEATGPAEVRVYGGSGELLLGRCNDQGGCRIERDGERRRFVIEVPLNTPGMVHAVVFIGANVPASAGARALDLETAAGAGIRTATRPPTRVL
jgi:hypothetical protein